MRISDLTRNDVIKIFGWKKLAYILAIVDETGGTNKENGIYFWAKVELEDGRKIDIDDSWDFEKVNEPFTRKVDMQEEQDMVHEPPHYQFGKFSARMIIELVYALMSGDIYMARINDDGTMNLRNRRIATDDVMKAAAEWFIGNKKTVVHFGGHGTLAWIPEKDGLSPQDVKKHIDELKS